jgi:hypothetical protein
VSARCSSTSVTVRRFPSLIPAFFKLLWRYRELTRRPLRFFNNSCHALSLFHARTN